jgi:hypothetical protein
MWIYWTPWQKNKTHEEMNSLALIISDKPTSVTWVPLFMLTKGFQLHKLLQVITEKLNMKEKSCKLT